MSDLIEGLNPQQAEAVQTVNGPVLVLAGPGSGKTRVLTRRIAYLIEQAGVAPWQIVAVTFTNKAAREMRARVEELLGDRFGAPLPGQNARLGGLTIGTFHSICARVLRIETAAIGYDRNWVIYDSADQRSLVRALMREMNLDERHHSPNAIKAHISKQKNELVTPDQYRAHDYFQEIAGRVYSRYEEALRVNNAMDFDDLLMKTTLLLKENIELRAKYQDKWQYILVDEFQDTNSAQFELIRLLANEPNGKRNLFGVGDEDQSIYRFRGADYRNVRNFRHEYPDAKVILLEQNYRSTQNILDVANAVIENNLNRTPKRLHTENGEGIKTTLYEAYNAVEEAAWVCEEIERLVNSGVTDLGGCAIMYRTNAQSRALEETFVVRNIKHKLVGATRFYERKEIKDALSYLRLVHNPSDSVAMDRIINVPARGIGLKTYASLKSWANELNLTPYEALMILLHGPDEAAARLARPLPDAAQLAPPLGTRARNSLVAFAKGLESWVQLRRNERYQSVADLLDYILDEAGYVDSLRDGTDEGEERFENLQELRGVAAQYKPDMAELEPEQTALTLFLEEVSLVSDADQIDEGGGAVTLMTLHTAKGLEYPVVFLVGLEDGILPHIRSIESTDSEDMDEERRLYYVGITRAQKRLYLVHAFRRNLWGEVSEQEPSRFIDEIPSDLLQGMVDRHSRKSMAYQRASSWDSDWDNDWEDNSWDESNEWQVSTDQGSVSSGNKSSSYSSFRQKTERQQTDWSSSRSQGRRAITRPARGQEAAQPTKFKARDSIQHQIFGVGTVIESKIVHGDEEVTIAFPGIGIKKLAASMAQLIKL